MGLAFLFLHVDWDYPHISSKVLRNFLVKSKLWDQDQIYALLEFLMTHDHQLFVIYQKRVQNWRFIKLCTKEKVHTNTVEKIALHFKRLVHLMEFSTEFLRTFQTIPTFHFTFVSIGKLWVHQLEAHRWRRCFSITPWNCCIKAVAF